MQDGAILVSPARHQTLVVEIQHQPKNFIGTLQLLPNERDFG